MSSKGRTCPAWEHLRPNESDDAATLRSKVEQLEHLSMALHLTLARVQERPNESTDLRREVVETDGDVHRDILADELFHTSATPSKAAQPLSPSQRSPRSACVEETSRLSFDPPSKSDDSVDSLHGDGEELHVPNAGLTLQVQLPVEAAKLSKSGRYLCGVLQCPPDSTSRTSVKIVVWELGGSFAHPPKTIGTVAAESFDPAESETSASNSWDLMETSQGVLVVMSGRFRMEPTGHEAIRCFLPTSGVLQCFCKLKLNEKLHSIATTGNTIIAAGADGKGLVWNNIGGEKERCSKELPQAKYKQFPFDWITELRLLKGREEWVVGLSSQGSIVLWDHQRLQILTTVHHATFHISDIHVLPADSCSVDVTSNDTPLAFVGCIVERDNPNSQRSVAGMLLRSGLFNVGSAFPVEGVERICGYRDNGLACMTNGEVVVWNIVKGKHLWWSDDYKDKIVTATWMGCEVVVVATQCGLISVRKLSPPKVEI